jgi:hypothetical protein
MYGMYNNTNFDTENFLDDQYVLSQTKHLEPREQLTDLPELNTQSKPKQLL